MNLLSKSNFLPKNGVSPIFFSIFLGIFIGPMCTWDLIYGSWLPNLKLVQVAPAGWTLVLFWKRKENYSKTKWIRFSFFFRMQSQLNSHLYLSSVQSKTCTRNNTIFDAGDGSKYWTTKQGQWKRSNNENRIKEWRKVKLMQLMWQASNVRSHMKTHSGKKSK